MGAQVSKLEKKNSKEIRAITDHLKNDFKVGGESKKFKFCKKKSSLLSFDSNLREKVKLCMYKLCSYV